MELESFGVRHYIMSPQCLAELETFGGYSQRGWREGLSEGTFLQIWASQVLFFCGALQVYRVDAYCLFGFP